VREWINVTQDRDWWRALLDAIMNLDSVNGGGLAFRVLLFEFSSLKAQLALCHVTETCCSVKSKLPKFRIFR
jgi:hypothetical protein